MMKKDLVSFRSYSKEEIEKIIHISQWIKGNNRGDVRPLRNKTAALIFEKPSLRTHVSFEVGIAQLGGHAVFLSQKNIGMSTRESVVDIAEVLSRYNDLIVARTVKHSTVEDIAAYAAIPVINALTDLLHPCQIMADVFTLRERGLLSAGTKLTFIGDGNNVVNSWLELVQKIPLHFVLACPEGYEPDAQILAEARASGTSRIEIVHDPFEAAEDADVLYTDVWVSMGQEEEKRARHEAFEKYQINSRLLTLARPECVIMHCLPAHRGEEITAEVLEGSRSIVLAQAENRLHAQKAIMIHLMDGGEHESRASNELKDELTIH